MVLLSTDTVYRSDVLNFWVCLAHIAQNMNAE